MKKISFIAIIAILMCFMFAGCSGEKNFGKIVKYDRDEISRVAVASAHSVVKEFDKEAIDKLWAEAQKLKFDVNEDLKFEPQYSYEIRIYIKDTKGYIIWQVDREIKGSADFDGKVKSDWYAMSNGEQFKALLNDLFYL